MIRERCPTVYLVILFTSLGGVADTVLTACGGPAFAAAGVSPDAAVFPADTPDGTAESAQTGTEAGAESGTEAGTETGTEAGTEAGTETGVEAGAEAGTEAGTDAPPCLVFDETCGATPCCAGLACGFQGQGATVQSCL